MPKRKTITVVITPIQRKSLGYLILDQKLGKNLLSHLARTYKASYVKTNRSYYLIVIMECTGWIVYAMLDILAIISTKKKKY